MKLRAMLSHPRALCSAAPPSDLTIAVKHDARLPVWSGRRAGWANQFGRVREGNSPHVHGIVTSCAVACLRGVVSGPVIIAALTSADVLFNQGSVDKSEPPAG